MFPFIHIVSNSTEKCFCFYIPPTPTYHGDHDDDYVGTQPRKGLAGDFSDGGHQEEDVDQDHDGGDGEEADVKARDDVAVSHSSDVQG